ncbi:trigger factor [Corynebacterium pygosceleis]|uniref:Trigger factor n=1 Tax=Corynebacterium pygosceleis TaxID=2800406 RepID=A0A9Q4CAW6_9CORY|nr:trigger factor [Corynebacterium pygosceleis]MCK7636413.1 trigger factor [Corynebacterium pygosceleis]MCL0121397.1 trigger factor [Corynebacterium pygosceleis]MCX7445602.1 trigger factor [Corynebacterium pygosceleis]MCX7469273.1 trigger factor [Corynebacterium pygosceleis]
MKSSVEQLNDTRVKITVEVPFEDLKPEFDQAYKALAQQVSIPGFRKGKAPRQLIEARVGRGPVLEQVVNDMLPSRYGAAVEENDLKVIGQPVVDVTRIEDGELVEFTAEVDVRPEITLPDFSDISVEVAPLATDDEAVEAELQSLRERFGSLKNVDRAVAENDFVTVDLSATVDGETIEEATTEGLSHQVGSGELIEGLDETLVGMEVGESREFTTKLLAGEHEGKEALVTVTVGSVKERELPEVDDEFAQLASEFDTVEELRESLVQRVEESGKAQQAAEIRDEVLKAALEKSEFPLPESIVDEQVNNQVQQLVSQFGGDEKKLNERLKLEGSSREEFDKDAREQAENAVRTQLFLDVLADKVQPEVSQEEMTEHIIFTAQRYGMDPNQFIQQLQQAGQIGNLFSDVRRGKALAAAICEVTVTDSEGTKVDPAAYFGEEESDDSADSNDGDKAAE